MKRRFRRRKVDFINPAYLIFKELIKNIKVTVKRDSIILEIRKKL